MRVAVDVVEILEHFSISFARRLRPVRAAHQSDQQPSQRLGFENSLGPTRATPAAS